MGDGRERDAIVRQVADLNLNEDVTFLGYRRDVPNVLQGIDVVVIPSDKEAFPRVALEAMAMRKPLIVSDAGGLTEAVEHGRTGIVVPRGDVEALTVALAELIADSAMRAAMGARGQQRVREYFSLERNTRRTKDVYAELLGCAGA